MPVDALLAQPAAATRWRWWAPTASTTWSPVTLGLFDDADGLVQVTGTRLGRRPAGRGAEPMTIDTTASTTRGFDDTRQLSANGGGRRSSKSTR